jgi:hypothetical protein
MLLLFPLSTREALMIRGHVAAAAEGYRAAKATESILGVVGLVNIRAVCRVDTLITEILL